MHNGRVFDWNDARHFLAVAREGSTLAAGRRLGVDQTTVARRIAALERALGGKLFDRAVTGYRLTDAGRAALPAAERLEAEAGAFVQLVEQHHRRLSGTIRLTTNEVTANMLVMPSLPDFAALYPDIRIEMIVDSQLLDVGRGEADVALRAAQHPGTGPIVARRLRDLPWALYCSPAYARANGCPRSAADLAGHAIVGGEGWVAELRAVAWLEAMAGSDRVAARSNNLPALAAASGAGLGLCALPCGLGGFAPDLIHCMDLDESLHSALWLVTREQVRDEPRIRAFTAFLAARIVAMRSLFDERPTRSSPGAAGSASMI